MTTANQMTAGFGLGEVNPPLGMPMEGLGQEGGCQTIHDDLFVRVLALAAGRQQVLLVGFDLLFFERPVIDRFKAALWRRFGLAPDRILLNNSHTHAGPRLTRWAYGGDADPVYLDKIEAALVQAADQALAGLKPVRLEAGMATTDVPVSRRKPGPDGLTQWAPYLGGEVCNALPFCLFRDRTDAVVCLLFSVSCHPSMIYSLDISADYPGTAVRQLNRHFQTSGALFLQGAGGDTKPRQIAEKESHWRHGTWGEVEAAGKAVAEAIVTATSSPTSAPVCSRPTGRWSHCPTGRRSRPPRPIPASKRGAVPGPPTCSGAWTSSAACPTPWRSWSMPSNSAAVCASSASRANSWANSATAFSGALTAA